MTDTAPRNEQTLNAQLEQVQQRLAELAQDLRSIEGELEGLSADRQKHRLLAQVCDGLQELDALGAGGLFWGEHAATEQASSQLLVARGRVDAFDKRVREIEDRREVVLDQITQAQDDNEIAEDDLYQFRQREEFRKSEWVIEREVESFPSRYSLMPWTRGGEDDQRFRKTLAAALLLSLLFGLLFPMIELPIPDRWEVVEVPERLTRLIREVPPTPPPPPPVLEKKKPEEQEELQKVAEEKPVEKPTKTPKATAKPAPKGILAFREKFSGLSEAMPAARLGAQARIRRPGQAASGAPSRSLVTSSLPGSSGGIDVGTLSRDLGGGGNAITGVEVARAQSSIGSGTGTGADRPLADGPGPARTDEEIQIVFDRHKAALYRLYNRELRRDPTLRGQMVLRIRIEPDGSVSLCELQSSDMNAPNLATQVLSRVKAFDFGAKEGVGPITILYPIDFLPAA